MSTMLRDRELEMELELELELESLSPTRLFSCSPPERAQVVAALGRPATPAQLRSIVGGSIAQARREAANAARLLRAHPRSAFTTATFRGVFGVPPTWVAPWRPAGASWRDHGELVALRLERAAGILGGGHMHLFCWGSVAHCPECTGPPTSYRACSSYRGRYHICLGRSWWRWARHGHRGFMASTLLHEALHVYFVLEHHRAAVGRPSVNNVHCYDTLVARLHRRAPKPCDAERCRGVACP